MPPIGRRLLLGLGYVWLAWAILGCASTPSKPAFTPTGDLLVDGPNAIANGPPRDRVLWAYRTAAAALRKGDFALARQMLDEALLTIGGLRVNDKEARKARGYFTGEAKKTFIGEPYERCMAYLYRGILYWMEGEPDNARACFRSAAVIDGDTEKQEYAGDWVLAEYLDGLATTKLAGDGSDAFKRAQAVARGVTLPPYRRDFNVLFFFEFGPGTTKYATGEIGEQLRFRVADSPVASAQLKINGATYPIAPTDDVFFQATTRGGRVMDHILGNKAVFKGTTDAVGDAALIGGLGAAAISRDRTTQQVGLGIAMAGLLSKALSAATVPAADTRAWDNLPRYLSFAALPLPPGRHEAIIEFKDASGQVVSTFTKVFTLNIPADGRDKVVFVSDRSATPQTL
ncbi:MAG TPA: hypothetical protein P5038_06345 [Candidatus Paceibacterota bacterium]|nr:hypothetical protein [Candidatus Paceibacterota bacterium]